MESVRGCGACEIRIAANSGFCFGVKRAVTMAQEAANDGKVYSLGPLIHNPREIERLSPLVGVVGSLEDVAGVQGENPVRVVIRSHGVGPEVYAQAEQMGIELIDATCPFVKKAQKAAEKLYREGFQVVIVGDHDHPEIIGIKSWTDNTAWVVSNVSEAAELPDSEGIEKIGVVAQTTQTQSNFAEVLAVLEAKYPQVRCENTICRATQERQQAAAALSAEVDRMVVIGGKNSANTKKLLQICQDSGVSALLVEEASELPADLFDGASSVGVCAGASTPDWIIEEVVVKMTEQNEVMEQSTKRNFAEEMSFVAGAAPKAETPAAASAKAETPAKEEKETVSLADMGDDVSFAELFDHGIKDIHRGLCVQGTVVQVRDNELLVDIGSKSEGILPSNQLLPEEAENIKERFHVGDLIDVIVIRKENKEGYPVLSKRMVDVVQLWDKLSQAKEDGTPVSGKIVEAVKGGVLMDVGIRGFVPYSQIDTKFVEDVKEYLGKEMTAKVIECDKDKNRLLLSTKAVKLEEQQKQQEALWADIAEGQTRTGVVSRLTNFGAFIDLGGVDGLLHVSQMAWFRINHPSDILKEGDQIEVYVMGVDAEKKKISLGLKQLIPNPWSIAAEKYPVGSVVNVTIMRTAPFGAFAQLEPGVEGLIHISQLARTRVEKTEDVVAPGQTVDVKVLSIDAENKRLSLSIRELLEDEAKSGEAEVPVELPVEEAPAEEAPAE
jgi:4-hydroxy-3-methylbut-2-enyl diphosphate reductase